MSKEENDKSVVHSGWKKWFDELRSHILFEGLKEVLKYVGVVVGGILSSSQWFQHHYGLWFIIGLVLFALCSVLIGITIERRRHSELRATKQITGYALALFCVGTALFFLAAKREEFVKTEATKSATPSAEQSPADPNPNQIPAKKSSNEPQSTVAQPHQTEQGDPNILVWVNTASGKYHCPGSQYYQNTGHGTLMKQAKAQAQNYVPAWHKVCQ